MGAWTEPSTGAAARPFSKRVDLRCSADDPLSLKDIAFPAISTGVYRYPKEKAALVAFAAVRDFLASSELPEIVYFVFYSLGDARIFLDTVE